MCSIAAARHFTACRSWEFYDFSEIAKKKRGRMAKLTSAVIVNLTEQSWTLHRSYGAYRIRGCENGEPYALTRVEARTAYMDLGDKRTMEIPISAVEVAEDLCREVNSDAGEESNLGVFVAKGEMPTSEELRKGRERLAAFYRRLVAGADREWERSHSYLFINDVERRAAHYLGIEKDWFYQPREMVECPACGEKIKPEWRSAGLAERFWIAPRRPASAWPRRIWLPRQRLRRNRELQRLHSGTADPIDPERGDANERLDARLTGGDFGGVPAWRGCAERKRAKRGAGQR
jgi:hypothetical protein